MLKKNILLICYSFPPYPGIGGRRWAKFAKYLSRQGATLHVVSCENIFENRVSNWEEDVSVIPSIIRYRLPAKYPMALLKPSRSFMGKIKYLAGLFYVRQMIRGDYFDKAGLWRDQLLASSTELINKFGIDNVIVSGAPNHLCYHACELKKINERINLIVDLRDPWTIHNEEWSFGQLNKRRKDQEIGMENEVLRTADHVVSVYDVMTQHYSMQFPEMKAKFHTIPNGYDPDDLQLIGKEREVGENKEKMSFVFSGTLYDNLEYLLYPFFDTLNQLRTKDQALYSKLSFDFYGNFNAAYEEKRNALGIDIVKFHGEIPLADSFKKIRNADYCMLFLIKNYSFSLSTKFYEYVAQRKKIVAIAEKGGLTDIIEKNHIGYVVSPETMYPDLLKAVSEYGKEPYFRNSNFDISQFELTKLTAKVAELLK